MCSAFLTRTVHFALVPVLVLLSPVSANLGEGPNAAEKRPSEITDTSTMQATAQDAMSTLHVDDKLAACNALQALTQDSRTTTANIDALLNEAAKGYGPMSARWIRDYRGNWPYHFGDFHTFGSVILGRLADASREIVEDDLRELARGKVITLAQEAVSENIASIPPENGLRAVFYSVFFAGSELITPAESESLNRVLQIIHRALSHRSPEVRDEAGELLWRAALVSPQKCDEILSWLPDSKRLRGQIDFNRGMAQTIYAESDYRKAQKMGVQELADLILTMIDANAVADLQVRVMGDKLCRASDRNAVILRLLSSEDFRHKYWYYLAPARKTENADPIDKQLVDSVLDLYEKELPTAKTYAPNGNWVVSGLAQLTVSPTDLDDIRRRVQASGASHESVYALERVLALLFRALTECDAGGQAIAAQALGTAAWLGGSEAHSIVVVLTSMKENRSTIETLDTAISDAQQALTVFEQFTKGEPAANTALN